MLTIAVFAPLLGIFLIACAPSVWAKKLALLGAGFSLLSTVGLLLQYNPAVAGFQFISELTPERSGISLKLGVDGISLWLLLLAGIVSFAAISASTIETRAKEYYIHFLLILTAALGAFASLNLLYFFIFCELATLPKYLLISVFGKNDTSQENRQAEKRAALKLTLFMSFGAMLVLVGFILLYFAANFNFDITHIQTFFAQNSILLEQQQLIFGLLVLGFGVWMTLWPFHGWAPTAYAAATPQTTMFFAGVLKNLGIYGLLRFGFMVLPQAAEVFAEPLAMLAMITILYAGILALKQKTWNDLIAYSSISHVGYALLGLAALNVTGATGTVFFMFVHGLLTALLFLMTLHLQQHTQSRNIEATSGLVFTLPFLSFCSIAALLAASGMAGFGNFISEILIFFGAWQQGSIVFQAATAVGILGVVLTAWYMLRAIRTTFYGPQTDLKPIPLPWNQRLIYIVLLLSLLVTGIYPRLVLDTIEPQLQTFLQRN